MIHTVGDAVDFASWAHRDQRRVTPTGASEPYVHHSIRVAMAVHRYGRVAQLVAVLHDVLEDTEITLDALAAVTGHYVADCVNTLTRPEGVSYEDFIRSVLRYNESIVTAAKIADLHDNIETSKGTPFEKHTSRWVHALSVLGYAV